MYVRHNQTTTHKDMCIYMHGTNEPHGLTTRQGYGLEWDTRRMRVLLPQDKMTQIASLSRRMLHTNSVRVSELMALLGKTNFASMAVPLGRMNSRPLQQCLPRGSGRSLRSVVSITSEARVSLHWWTSPPRSGRSINLPLPDSVLATDASLSGWGARFGHRHLQGQWSRAQMNNHINYLELLVVYLSLQHWTSLMSHHIIALQIDNTTAVAYLVKEGGTQSKALCELAAKILNFAEEHRINLRPSYLPGLLNTEADALSRQKDTSDWMLEPAIARRIFRQFGRPLIDLFASRRSKQVSKYFTSDRHDLGALGTDALHQNWNY